MFFFSQSASRCSEIAKKWLNALDNLGLPVSSSVPSISICSLHFHPDDLKLNCKRKTLKPDALPSIKPEPPEPVDEMYFEVILLDYFHINFILFFSFSF